MKDGRIHVKSDDLPGFHFILEEDEKDNPLEALAPALDEFVPLFLAARLKAESEKPVSVRVRKNSWRQAITMHELAHYQLPKRAGGHERTYNLVAAFA
jgi:hypothetical protein